MHAATLGGIEVFRVVEIERMKLQPFQLFPDATDEAVAAQRSWLVPQFADADGGLYMNIQAYVVKTRHHTILVDACCGNGKQRPFAHLSNLNTDWLDRLKAAGIAPEDVDIVLCTHLPLRPRRLEHAPRGRPLGADLSARQGPHGERGNGNSGKPSTRRDAIRTDPSATV